MSSKYLTDRYQYVPSGQSAAIRISDVKTMLAAKIAELGEMDTLDNADLEKSVSLINDVLDDLIKLTDGLGRLT